MYLFSKIRILSARKRCQFSILKTAASSFAPIIVAPGSSSWQRELAVAMEEVHNHYLQIAAG